MQKKGNRLDRCRRKEIGWTGAEEMKYAEQVQKKGNRLGGAGAEEIK
jgi:hypothetical protein